MKNEKGGYKCGQIFYWCMWQFYANKDFYPKNGSTYKCSQASGVSVYHPYNIIPFVSCNFGNYGMKIIPYHLFDVVEAFASLHLTLKKLIEFFKNVRSLSCFGEKN